MTLWNLHKGSTFPIAFRSRIPLRNRETPSFLITAETSWRSTLNWQVNLWTDSFPQRQDPFFVV